MTTPLTYTIAIHGSPYASMAHHRGLKFCTAALASGHTINRIFFYHDAVYVALNTTVAPQDEIDLTGAWRDLSNTHNIELAVCIANGLKRGVVSDDEANRYELDHGTLANSFELVGLGQLIDGIAGADRYLEFPA